MKRLIVLWLSGCLLAAAAQAAEPPLGVDLRGLREYAREHNPELAVTRFDAEAAQQRVQPAGALPDPVLRTELMDFTNQGTDKGASLLPNEVGATRYTLMQSLPWFGKRDLRRGVAEADAAQAQERTAATWAELAARIRAAHAMHYVLTGSERLVRQTLTWLDGLERIARTRYANGIGVQADAIRAQSEKTMLQSELIAVQNEWHHTHARLNALLARPADAPLVDPERLPEAPSAARLEENALLERLMARNPQLRAAEAGIASATKGRDLAYAERYPDFTLGVAPTQSGSAVGSWDLMIELNIPLQQSSRRAREREADAMLSASDARRESLRNELRSDLSRAISALEASRRTEALIAAQLLPQAKLTRESSLAAYETGKLDFAALIEAQRQLLKVKQLHLQAQGEMQSWLAELEKLLGEEL